MDNDSAEMRAQIELVMPTSERIVDYIITEVSGAITHPDVRIYAMKRIMEEMKERMYKGCMNAAISNPEVNAPTGKRLQ